MLQAHRITDTKAHLRTSFQNATVGAFSRRVSYFRGRGFDSRLEGRSSCQAFHCFLLSLQANSCKPARCVTYRENSRTNRLLQLLCTNPSTINNTLMNSRHFSWVLETIKGESIFKWAIPFVFNTITNDG